ncbi:MAG: hypoxanthine phosphoribosyltransferase [Schwartzia sp. (in: firmicutes)]
MMMEDLEKVVFTPEDLAQKIRDMGAQISRDYAGKELFVVGILKGASMFTMDLLRAITIPLELDFIAVSSYGSGVSSGGEVKMLKDTILDMRGKNVLLCEDIIDSGTTMAKLLPMLEERNPASLKLCALLSKPSRRVAPVVIDYCGWEVPDEFIVGYGLDYAEKYRNLPCIGVLKREIYA